MAPPNGYGVFSHNRPREIPQSFVFNANQGFPKASTRLKVSPAGFLGEADLSQFHYE